MVSVVRPAVLGSQRTAVTVFLLLVLVAWLYCFIAPGGRLSPMHPGWSVSGFAAALAMWLAMTVGMMLPATFSAVLRAANTSYAASRDNTAAEGAARFTAGYLTAWSAYCLAATALEWALDEVGVLTHMMTIRSPTVYGGLLIAVGVYQLSSWKAEALDRCRPDLPCPTTGDGDPRTPLFVAGLRHGLACMVCCGPMMLLTLAIGMMSWPWMAAATGWVLLERLLESGQFVARITGAGLLVWGSVVALRLSI